LHKTVGAKNSNHQSTVVTYHHTYVLKHYVVWRVRFLSEYNPVIGRPSVIIGYTCLCCRCPFLDCLNSVLVCRTNNLGFATSALHSVVCPPQDAGFSINAVFAATSPVDCCCWCKSTMPRQLLLFLLSLEVFQGLPIWDPDIRGQHTCSSVLVLSLYLLTHATRSRYDGDLKLQVRSTD
jgi:hypothetical protein